MHNFLLCQRLETFFGSKTLLFLRRTSWTFDRNLTFLSFVITVVCKSSEKLTCFTLIKSRNEYIPFSFSFYTNWIQRQSWAQPHSKWAAIIKILANRNCSAYSGALVVGIEERRAWVWASRADVDAQGVGLFSFILHPERLSGLLQVLLTFLPFCRGWQGRNWSLLRLFNCLSLYDWWAGTIQS